MCHSRFAKIILLGDEQLVKIIIIMIADRMKDNLSFIYDWIYFCCKIRMETDLIVLAEPPLVLVSLRLSVFIINYC